MRDKILAMEAGRKLDSEIALRVFKVKEITVVGDYYFINPLDKMLPTYSSDMSAAWEIVLKLQPTLWVRMNSMMDEHFCGVGSPDMLWECKSKSMPEAICKAALLAVTP